MKHLLFTTTLLLLTFSSISAQETNEKETKKTTTFGIIGGFNENYLSNSSYGGIDLYGGLFMEKKLSDKFSLKTELNYSRIQAHKLNFIEIPLILKYKTSEKLSLYGGVQGNYLFEDKSSMNFKTVDKPFGFDVNFGVEYNLNKNWFIDGRFILRTTNQINNGANIKNIQSVRLGVGFRF